MIKPKTLLIITKINQKNIGMNIIYMQKDKLLYHFLSKAIEYSPNNNQIILKADDLEDETGFECSSLSQI